MDRTRNGARARRIDGGQGSDRVDGQAETDVLDFFGIRAHERVHGAANAGDVRLVTPLVDLRPGDSSKRPHTLIAVLTPRQRKEST